jgi:hypothetical protein
MGPIGALFIDGKALSVDNGMASPLPHSFPKALILYFILSQS